MRLVRSAQAAISAANTDPRLPTYQSQEVHYWTEIALWIFEYPDRDARCLDVGCGFGTLSLYLSELFTGEICCTDMVDGQITPELAAAHRLNYVTSNLELDPLPWEGPFDVIVMTEVLEHLNFYPVPTLARLSELLSPGGRIFLSTPDASEWGRVTAYYKGLDEMPLPADASAHIESGEWGYVDAHVWQYTSQELHRVIADAGLHVVREAWAPGVVYRHFNLELKAAKPMSAGPARGLTV
jgi:SAM-dependent methyltransferase